ncbi:MAG: preprotein translocase subunit SecE [Coxiellaceae bacterium]|jgi:preprotein translocase subunit SecE|nr:preprotein translocase subunit SecE [Coxiellaceae bacterium]
MEEKNTSYSKLDILCWTLMCSLVFAGIITNLYFRELAWSLRFFLGMILICISLGLLALTTHGKRVWTFIMQAQTELRRVVWPSREETIKTTAIVAFLVFVTSLILWAFDSILLWIVGWFTR